MKGTFLALVTGAFVLGLAAIPNTYGGGGTAMAGDHKPRIGCWRCLKCNNKDCLKRVGAYARDEFRALALSSCLICVNQYRSSCKVRV